VFGVVVGTVGGGGGRYSWSLLRGRGTHGMMTGKDTSLKVKVATMGLWTANPLAFLTWNWVMKGQALELAKM
jgi:hypothetical protein